MKAKMRNGKKGSGCPDVILLAVGIVSLIIFVATGWKLLDYYGEYREQKQGYDELAALRDAGIGETTDGMTAGGMSQSATGTNGQDKDAGAAGLEQSATDRARESSERLKAINQDYIGWITIPDTNVYYPMVQRDNLYYLQHDFMGKRSSHGAIFLDESCETDAPVVLIHGHHMKDGTMFGTLKRFKKKDFRENHESLYLDWGEGDEEYRIFAVALIDLTQDEFFRYDELPETAEEIEKYLRKLKQNALWYEEPNTETTGTVGGSAATEVTGTVGGSATTDVTGMVAGTESTSDERRGQIVVLSTCEYGTENQRMIVAAVRIF